MKTNFFTLLFAIVASIGTIWAETYSGTCGPNLTWSLNTEDSTLTILGSGTMDNYRNPRNNDYYIEPWYEYRLYVVHVSFPDGITHIGDCAFHSCTNLTTITLPNSVTSIGGRVFGYCTNLRDIVISKNLTDFGFFIDPTITIAGTASYNPVLNFFLLENLQSITAPAGIFNIPEVFWHGYDARRHLVTVCVNAGELSDDAFGFINQSNKVIKKVDISAATNAELADEAFKGCYNIDTIILPQNLTYINYASLAECIKLKTIDIPASVTEIGDRAFENCRSLDSVSFHGNQLSRIGNWAFYNAHALQHLEIPEGVEEIGDGAFYGCSYLADIHLPASVCSIGDNGFAQCNKIRKMVVDAVEPPSIDNKTFLDVNRQIPVYVPDNSINDYTNDPLWGEFFIQGVSAMSTAVDNTTCTSLPQKVLRNGQIFILRGEKTYTLTGAEVK